MEQLIKDSLIADEKCENFIHDTGTGAHIEDDVKCFVYLVTLKKGLLSCPHRYCRYVSTTNPMTIHLEKHEEDIELKRVYGLAVKGGYKKKLKTTFTPVDYDHHGASTVCHFCAKENPSVKHRYTCKALNANFHQCTECGYKALDRSKLILHMDKHKNEKARENSDFKFLCRFCNRKLANHSSRSHHHATCKANPNRISEQWKCPHCLHNFTKKGSLKYHLKVGCKKNPGSMKNDASKQQLWQCPQCQKNFSFKSSLTRHLKHHCNQAS